jgi:YD repeat-containing protein
MTFCAPGVGFSAGGPFLSSEVYAGSRETGTKLRSVYVEYGADGVELGGGWMNQEKNHRLVYQKTVFHDDGDKYKEVTHADFDGLGNFRQTTAAGTFSGQDHQAVTTDYNADAGTLVVNPSTGSTAGSTFVMPTVSDPWVLGTFTTRKLTAAGETATAEHCFDEATGFLERTRVLAGTGRAAKDLLTVFEPETIGGQSTGRVAVEKLYGGDDQFSMDGTYGSLCEMTLPFQPKYETHHAYSHGVRSASTAIDPCDGRELLSLADLTIDANTGLVSSSRNAAGVETVLVYDALGRLTSERPEDTAWTEYVYQLPTEASPGLLPTVTVKDCANGSTGCSTAAALTWQRYDYDALGRQSKERLRLPTTAGLVDNVKSAEYSGRRICLDRKGQASYKLWRCSLLTRPWASLRHRISGGRWPCLWPQPDSRHDRTAMSSPERAKPPVSNI